MNAPQAHDAHHERRGSGPSAAPSNGRDGRAGPVFPEETVTVTPWPDPVLDNLGHDPRSLYVERYWLSILGPSSLLLLRRLAGELERQPDGFSLRPARWAAEMGLGMKGGKHGPFWRSLERCCRFGAARRNGSLLTVRRRLPPLTLRQVERLPEQLQLAHQQWAADRLASPVRSTISKWTPRDRAPSAAEPERRLDDAA